MDGVSVFRLLVPTVFNPLSLPLYVSPSVMSLSGTLCDPYKSGSSLDDVSRRTCPFVEGRGSSHTPEGDTDVKAGTM